MVVVCGRVVCSWSLSVAGRVCSADLDPFHQFITLLHSTGFNYSLLLDLLMSPETMFLLYLVRTVKHIAQCWTSWTRVCHSYDTTQRGTDDVLSTCRKRRRRGDCEPLLSDNEDSSPDTRHVIGQRRPGHPLDCAVIGRRVESARSVKRLIVEYSSSSDDDDCTTDGRRVDASQDTRGVDTSQDGRGVDASQGSACRTIINTQQQQQQQQRVDMRHSEHQHQLDEHEQDEEDEEEDDEQDEEADDDEEDDEHEEEEKKDQQDEEDDDERVGRSDEQLRDTSDASTRSRVMTTSRDSSDASTLSRDSSTLSRDSTTSRDSSDASTLSRDSSTLSRVMSVLTQLTSVLSRLVANDMFPFDVQPLLRHLHRSQMLYRHTHPPT